MTDTQDLYPEHTKLTSISDTSQKIGEFIDWLRSERGIDLTEYNQYEDFHYTTGQRTDQLLADFFGIDQDKIEAEKRAMLESLRG